MNTSPTTTNPVTTPMLADLSVAFLAVRSEIDAVPDTALIRMNFDIPYAATTAMGAAERIEQLMPELAELPGYELAPVRAMPTYAAAALHAHLLGYEPDPRPPSMPALFKEASRLRGDLSVLADALARLGLFSATHVAAIRGGKGHVDMANALCALATLYEQKWPEIGSRVPISREMVARAARIGMELQLALGKRRLPSEPRSTRDARHVTEGRAMTLFVNAYDHCRRGVTFVRWCHGDIEHFVPSLYPKRKRRLQVVSEAPDSEPVMGEVSEPTEGSES